MVKRSLVLWLLVATLASGQDTASPEKKGPVLYGEAGGRLWVWDGGTKTYLTPEGMNLVLGGVGAQQLWGWSLLGGQAQFFTVKLPRPKAKASQGALQAAPPPKPVFDRGLYPVPDRADRVGDRLLLVYDALSGHPRYEVWQGGRRLATKALDDGRVVYAEALGPTEGWVVAGRDGAGAPWVEVSGVPVPAPEGWRGRMTVALWVADQDKVPAHPVAAGWGAPGTQGPRPLLWGPEGWTQTPVAGDQPPGAGSTYPVLGVVGKSGVFLGGWAADGTGGTKPWFWDGAVETLGTQTVDGVPEVLGLDKAGFLVVKHPSAPWFTLDDEKGSTPLEGLTADDTVVAVQAAPPGP